MDTVKQSRPRSRSIASNVIQTTQKTTRMLETRTVVAGSRVTRVPQPRTAVAIDREGRTLFLVIVDGRQPNYSEGLNFPELARFLKGLGAHDAINLDGGGSSTLAIEGPDGMARVLNSPIHGRVPPGRERPVATHLGIYAHALPPGG